MTKTLLALAGLLLPPMLFAGPINVNTANAEAISQELKGIGLSKAKAIVDYREQNGAFDVPAELLKVKGIGPRVLAANEDNIRVKD